MIIAIFSLVMTFVSSVAPCQADKTRYLHQDWFPQAPESNQGRYAIHVHNVKQLYKAAQQVRPNQTILLADGHYRLKRRVVIKTSQVSIRGASGNRDAVVIDGEENRHGDLLVIMNCEDVLVAGITLRNARHNAIKLSSDKGVNRIQIRNCVIQNAWQRGIKSVRSSIKCKDCVVEYCVFHNERPKTFRDDPKDKPGKRFNGNYVGGIDIMDAVNWRINDCVFVGIQGRTREGRAAIFIWNDSLDCIVERNIIIDCDAGICLGNTHVREDVVAHCVGCIVRNNFISHCPEEPIFAALTRDCIVDHNSVFSEVGA